MFLAVKVTHFPVMTSDLSLSLSEWSDYSWLSLINVCNPPSFRDMSISTV